MIGLVGKPGVTLPAIFSSKTCIVQTVFELTFELKVNKIQTKKTDEIEKLTIA